MIPDSTISKQRQRCALAGSSFHYRQMSNSKVDCPQPQFSEMKYSGIAESTVADLVKSAAFRCVLMSKLVSNEVLFLWVPTDARLLVRHCFKVAITITRETTFERHTV